MTTKALLYATQKWLNHSLIESKQGYSLEKCICECHDFECLRISHLNYIATSTVHSYFENVYVHLFENIKNLQSERVFAHLQAFEKNK